MRVWVQLYLQPIYLVHPPAWCSPLVLGAACAVGRGPGDFWGVPVFEVLWSLGCSGPRDALVPRVLRFLVSMGLQGSPVPGILQSLLEEASGTTPVLGFSPALHFPPQ